MGNSTIEHSRAWCGDKDTVYKYNLVGLKRIDKKQYNI